MDRKLTRDRRSGIGARPRDRSFRGVVGRSHIEANPQRARDATAGTLRPAGFFLGYSAGQSPSHCSIVFVDRIERRPLQVFEGLAAHVPAKGGL
jgi:hypothetical protein